jgi:hypothetical protein
MRGIRYAALALVTACGADPATIPDGVLLTDSSPDHIAGSFGQDGVGVTFTFTTTAGVRAATIRDRDGRPLLDAQLDNGVETIHYLGDRLVLQGTQGQADPTMTGDATAYAELTHRPEAALFGPLRGALDIAGVAREMYAMPAPTRSAEPQWNGQILNCGQHVAIPTYSWWWSVETVWYNLSHQYTAVVHIQDGALNYYPTDAPYPNGYVYNDWNYWSWWTIYFTNTCWDGPVQVYVDSQLL